MMGGPNTLIDFALSMPSGGDARDPQRVVIRLEDSLSRLIFLEVELSAEQFVKAMRGQYFSNLPAWMPDDMSRVGKVQEHEAHRFTKEELDALGTSAYARKEPEVEEKLLSYGRRTFPGWESYSITWHNYGPSMTMRRWRERTPDDLKQEVY